jgi:hypothetical protein
MIPIASCGPNKTTSETPKNVMNRGRSARTYASPASDFSGKYSGKISVAANNRITEGYIEILVYQNRYSLQSIQITLTHQGNTKTAAFPPHDIKGNDLMDTVSDHARSGKIDSAGLMIDRSSVGKISLEIHNSKSAHFQFSTDVGTSLERHASGNIRRD